MCGIAGIIEAPANSAASRVAVVETMVGALHHRGPNGAGVASCDATHAVVGATRLALLDDDGGAQPWRFEAGNGAGGILVFNGELYNHPELATALTAAGAFPPRSSCDTETLARGWQTVGASIWSHLDGMFAAAIVDNGELVLARDPHGQKPLFIWREAQGRALAFASEVGALLAEPRVQRCLDSRSLVEYGAIGFPLRDDTLLAGVRSLPPGHELRVRVGRDGRLHESQRDFRTDTRERGLDVRLPDPCGGARRNEDPIEALATTLPTVVTRHTRADHPVGLFLSGGLDSGLLAALMVEHGPSPVHTFTLADDPTHPDLVAARQFASQIGTIHHERIVDADDMESAWPLTVAVQGLPLAPTIAELGGPWVRQWVKAALVGDGADELFAGYRYHQVPRRTIGSMAHGYNRMVRRGAVPLGAGDRLRAELQSLKAAESAGLEGSADALRRFLAEDRLAVNHLRRWDHGALAHGLEVRLPYLSRPITEIADGLTWEALVRARDGQPVPGKAPLRAAARRLLPETLWRSLTERAKVSAPSALANARAALNARCREWMPLRHRERHPLAACAADEVALMSIDLLAAIYLLEVDGLPVERAAKLRAARLYEEHGDALEDYWCRYSRALNTPTTTRHRDDSNKQAPLHARWIRGTERYASAALELTTYTASNSLLAKIADLRPGMRIIDLACGAGATSRAAFARQPELAQVFAVDWSAPMLDEARGVLAGLPVLFQQASAGALAPVLGPHLVEGRVQRVLCNAALFQFPDYAGVLADLRPLLADDGRFAFTVPVPTQGPTIASVLDRCGLYPLGRATGTPPKDPTSSSFLCPPPPGGSERAPPPQPNFDERVAATEAAGWRVLDSQVRTFDAPIEEHVRWLMLPMFRHPSWNHLPEDELQSRLTEALRRESDRYPAAWRAIVIAPG